MSDPAWLRNQAVVLLMGEVAVLVLAAGPAATIFSTLLAVGMATRCSSYEKTCKRLVIEMG